MVPTPIQLTFTELVRSLLLSPGAKTRRRGGRDGGAIRRTVGGRAALQHRLRRYEEELERLRIENEHLRQSATTFGELAERRINSLRSVQVRENV